ncbi:hypothetical protein DPMN_026515 [Dreissena polymorpha]|uniref:Uncharacterized protein n=1 Tax=Dreissena polymorpha TaxID=45954 RepID=A0A9D4LT36_DREPO|nr:hypothetical protein DPMN_026515 [Dreissena polymorpha]
MQLKLRRIRISFAQSILLIFVNQLKKCDTDFLQFFELKFSQSGMCRCGDGHFLF